VSWWVVTGKSGVEWRYINGMENGKAKLNLIQLSLIISRTLSLKTLPINLVRRGIIEVLFLANLGSFLEPVSGGC